MIRKPLIGSSHIELYSAIDNDLLDDGGSLMLLLSDVTTISDVPE